VTRLAASVAFLYPELPYLERFAAARRDGFEAIETTWPAVGADAVVGAAARAGLRVVLLNVREGDLAAGDRGYPNDPARVDEWRRDLDAALDLAAALRCPTANVLAGNALHEVDLDAQRACLAANLAWALSRATARGIGLVVELLNAPEHRRYLARDLEATLAIIAPHADAGLRLQFDTYHVARNGLDVAVTLRDVAPLVGHVQIADAPGRHEPGTGAIDWAACFAALDETGYEGAVGLEYRPLGDTSAGLAWLPRRARGHGPEPYAALSSGGRSP
jgi:hydroxypyruvate isomerase